MKIERKDLIKYIIIGIVILLVFILVIFLLGRNKEDTKINLNKTSDNYLVDDSIVMNLYNRYNPERELMFNLVGSDTTNKDYYGYYYKKKKVSYKDLDDTVKSTILFNDADYRTLGRDDENNCYELDKVGYETIYNKLYGTDDYSYEFDEEFEPRVSVDDDSICISDDVHRGEYKNVIDTYMVNAVYDKDYIVIYERVAFIEIDDDYLYFYKDIEKKDLVYKLKVTKKLDMGFVNNVDIVSNVLLKYQDKFDLYEYRYKEGVDSYYFESVER